MKLNYYLKNMKNAFEIATRSIDKGASKTGYITGYLAGAVEGIKFVAIEDSDIDLVDYNILIAQARRYEEELEKYEGKSI